VCVKAKGWIKQPFANFIKSRKMDNIEEVQGDHSLKAWINTWDWIRLLRLLLGVALIIQGFMEKDWLAGGVGAFFAISAWMNRGCGGGSCRTGACSR
jgi:hypothetical protein